MSIAVIVTVSLLALGGLLFLVWQIPEAVTQSKKRQRAVPPPPPAKDWQGTAERMEKRLRIMETEAQAFQSLLKDKDKKVEEMNITLAAVRKQFDQEKAWREKEEAALQKEKKLERSLQEELNKTREALNHESTERIKQEHELKEIRQIKDEISGKERGLSSRVMDLERQLDSALKELKQLRQENAQLSKKKEDTEWVAKSDYKQLEAQARRTRFEAEEFKKAFPPSEWPASLQARDERKTAG
ncbi:MAG: hypothetical protein HQL22_09285 [Candidatus Omnitrophica bacterium]|nr:hypothetical protein [Candidatus Omnitrophota bacterium]